MDHPLVIFAILFLTLFAAVSALIALVWSIRNLRSTSATNYVAARVYLALVALTIVSIALGRIAQ